MAMLNRILGIAALVLALAAVALSFLLFQRRTEFRDRADKLAKTVSDVVQTLDQDSGTDLGQEVKFIPADVASGAKASGTLASSSYRKAKGTDGYDKILNKVKQLAVDIQEQRNLLAAKIAEAGIALGLSEQEISTAELSKIADKAKMGDMASQVTLQALAVKNRDDAMIKTLLTSSSVINKPIDEKKLTERQQNMEGEKLTKGEYDCLNTLTEYAGNITNLNTRTTDYANTLAEAIDRIPKHQWSTDKGLIKNDKDYAGAMTNLLNDFDDINQKLAQIDEIKLQLEERTKELKTVSTEMDALRQDRDKIKQELTDKTAEVDRFRQGGGLSADGGPLTIDPSLEGRVVQINRDWSFVILDLGAAKVRENMEFLVARQDQLIARVVVSKVFPRFSIAEVLPEVQIKEIQNNDRVILPHR